MKSKISSLNKDLEVQSPTSPKLPSATSPNHDIHQNFPFALVGSGKSSHNNSQPYSNKVRTERRTGNSELQSIAIAKGISKGVVLPADNSIKMLPLTEVKGNC